MGDGAAIVLGPLADLQQVPLEDVRVAVQALLHSMAEPTASLPDAETTAPPGLADISPTAAAVSGATEPIAKAKVVATSCYPTRSRGRGRGRGRDSASGRDDRTTARGSGKRVWKAK